MMYRLKDPGWEERLFGGRKVKQPFECHNNCGKTVTHTYPDIPAKFSVYCVCCYQEMKDKEHRERLERRERYYFARFDEETDKPKEKDDGR